MKIVDGFLCRFGIALARPMCYKPAQLESHCVSSQIDELPDDPAALVEIILRQREQLAERDRIVRALRSLPTRARAMLVLRYYGGLHDAEIAEVLECAPGTVRSQISRAMPKLRAQLGEPSDALDLEKEE